MHGISRIECGFCLGLIGSLLFGGSVVADDEIGKKYAILVGVREYDRNQLKNLPFAENDVAELADILKQSGFRRVELLTQAEGATRARALPLAKTIRETIQGVLEDRQKDDLVLIAFAGHGVQFKGETENYFCPMDAVLTDRSTLISLTAVYDQLKKSNAGAKLLLVDACRNDPLAGNARAAGDVELQSLTRPVIPDPPGGVAALFSCSAGQRAFEDEMLKHGVFFHHVIRGLKGEAKLKKRDEVTWDSLVMYVKSEVPDTVKDLFGNTTRQIPEHRGELRGGVSLVSIAVPRSTPVPAASDLPKSITSEKTRIQLALIPADEFEMGSNLSTAELNARLGKWAVNEEEVQNERPAHRVRISRPFYLAKHEITVGQFRQFATDYNYHHTSAKDLAELEVARTNLLRAVDLRKKGAISQDDFDRWRAALDRFAYKTEAETDAKGGWGWVQSKSGYEQSRKFSWKDPGFVQTDDCPVVNVSWNDAARFCEWLSRKEGRSYRLPTEAEWEYACKAGSTTLWWNGNNPEQVAQVGNILDQSVEQKLKIKIGTNIPIAANDSFYFTAPVGSFAPNAFGLFDMYGNVMEWCQDDYEPKLYGQRSGTTVDPIQKTGAQVRILRGGAWDHTPANSRSTKRSFHLPTYFSLFIGFRVAMTP